MAVIKKEITIREIQKIASIIDLMKGSNDKEGKQVTPNYTEKWDATTIYWMGRLRSFCEPVVTEITETRNILVRKHGTQNNGAYIFEDNSIETFEAEIKTYLDGKETIRFPELKASSFVVMEGKDKIVKESLVPIDFWQVFTKHLVMDVKEFEVPEDEEEETVET